MLDHIFETYSGIFRILFEFACIVVTPFTIFTFFCIVLSGLISYKYLLQVKTRNLLLSITLMIKLKTIFLIFPISLVALLIFQSFIMIFFSFFPSATKSFLILPEFIIVLFSWRWLAGGYNLFAFAINICIFLLIISSFYEYDKLQENRGTVNSKKQIIKAVLFSNIPIALMVIGYFIYMYHTNPAMFR